MNIVAFLILTAACRVSDLTGEEPMGLPCVRELTLRRNLTEVFLPGMHAEAWTHISKGQAAHDMGMVLDEFFA